MGSRGGSRVNSGPPPDPRAFRRERPTDQQGWRTLPAGGRTGSAPKWPLLPDATRRAMQQLAETDVFDLEDQLASAETAKARAGIRKKLATARRHLRMLTIQIESQDANEKLLWVDLWKTPQAAAWVELGWTRDIAMYVRHQVLAELGSMDNAKEARQWSDRLGLTQPGMLRNRWRISIDEVAPRRNARTAAKKTAARRASSRSRLKVVPNAGTE